MNNPQDAVAFQAQLARFAHFQNPDPWSFMVMAALLLLAGMLMALAFHALLRYRFARSKKQSESHPVYLYPIPIRIWHWTNASLFILLLVSGLANRFALVSPKMMTTLVSFHYTCGLLLMLTWSAFVIINIVTGNGRHYVVQVNGLISRLVRQARYYLSGIVRGEPHPFHADETSKFNPLQQVAYIGVVYALIPLLIVTGLLSANPGWLGESLAPLRHWIFTAHLLLAIVSLFFLFGHIYLCTTGRTPTETFKAMLDGYHR